MNSEELKRQSRVTDQMITMYSVLRDRYACRATLLTLGILGSSVVLVACTFLPEDALNSVGVSIFITKVILGTFSSVVLFLSIAELRVDWKERSRQYADAAENLSRLKSTYRSIFTTVQAPSAEQITEITEKYNIIMDHLPRIPDKQFVNLKAYHNRKMRLSQMIDSAAGCPVWWLRVRLLVEGCRTKIR